MSSTRPLPNLEPSSKSIADEYIPGEFGEESLPSEFTEPAADKASDSPMTSPPVLVLAAPPTPEARFGTLFWLVRTLGLDIYGTTTLSYAARSEMIAVALMLTIIFLFDAGAWCLLFYFILNSGSLDFHFGGLLLSLGGILPALALLLYERGFMTSDTRTYGWRRLILPTALRLCAILGGAWITAQPVELMAFARRVEHRIQDELIRKDIVGHYHKLRKAQEDRSKGNIALAPRDEKKLNSAEYELKDKNQHIPEAEAELEKYKNFRDAAEARLSEARRQLAEAEATAAENPQSVAGKDAVEQKQQAVETAQASYNERTVKAAEQQRLRDTLKKSIETATTDVAALRTTLSGDFEAQTGEETEDKLLAWADRLRDIPPGKSFPEGDGKDPATGFKFIFTDYTFLDKFRIIDDLRAGRPARWPGAETDKIQSLRETYGLYDDNDNVTDPQSKERLAAEIKNAQRTYLAIFGVALIIPFMSLLFKIIMPAPLSYYYSTAWQSRQGHPEAMALEAAAFSMSVHPRRNGAAMSSKHGVPRGNTQNQGDD